MSTDTAPAGPALGGVKVLELANFLAGPMVGMFLADFGAEVIKLERPDGGDECRKWGNHRDGVGLYFKVLNRNKQSVTSDLRTELGGEIVRRLAVDTDVVIENFRPGTLDRWGIGYDALSEINPELIMVSVSAYGQTGPYSDRPGFGTLAEAFAGYAHITGEPDGPPLLPAFGFADASTGLMGALLACVALQARSNGAGGQHIDLGIYETMLTLLGPQVVDFDQLGVIQGRRGSRLPFTAPRNTFRTKDDRWIAVGGSAQSVFERICRALDRPELIERPEFADNRARVQNDVVLDDELQASISLLDFDELMRRFEHHEAAAAPVQDVQQIVEHQHVIARGNIATIDDDELGQVRMQNVVGKLSKTPGRIDHAGPAHGSSNTAVLLDRLGFTPEQLRQGGLDV